MPCSTESDFNTNLAKCTSDGQVKFYDWTVSYKNSISGMLKNEHLIEFEIKDYTWPNITPVTSNGAFFNNLEGTF